jgi:hypothetical protein
MLAVLSCSPSARTAVTTAGKPSGTGYSHRAATGRCFAFAQTAPPIRAERCKDSVNRLLIWGFRVWLSRSGAHNLISRFLTQRANAQSDRT